MPVSITGSARAGIVEGTFIVSTNNLPDGEDFNITGASGETGVVEIHNIVVGGACTVYLERDTDKDDNYETSVQIDQFSTNGISMKNAIEVDSHKNMRLRIRNESGSPTDFIVTGVDIER